MSKSNAIALFLTLATLAQAQNPPDRAPLGSGSVSNQDFTVTYQSFIEPSSGNSFPNIGGGVSASDEKGLLRYLNDDVNKRFTGYRLIVDPAPNGAIKLTLAALNFSAAQLGLRGPGWTSLPLPKYPAPQIIRQGQVVAIDLMVNPNTGQRIVDYLTVTPKAAAAQRSATAKPRDFRPDDAELYISELTIKINGQADKHFTPGSTLSGAAVWFQLPGKGRFTLTLTPNPSLGFRPAGEFRGTKFTFQHNGTTYSGESAARIVPADGAFTLYLHHNPNIQATEESLGAADTAELAVRMN